jgi:tetratricopeptide (TPR) repeat protein
MCRSTRSTIPTPWPTSPASRGFASLALAVLLLASGAAHAADQEQDNAGRYQDCLGLTHSAPAEALAKADNWHDNGGGFPAEHCAALALFGLKRYPEAAKRLEGLAGAMMGASSRMRADALDQAGQAWLLADRPADAKSDFDAALKLNKDDVDLLIDRAEAYYDGKKFPEAVADLDHALELAPGRADALVYRASAYRQLDRLDLALKDIDAAFKLQPENGPALLERGNIKRLSGDAAGARADWLKVEEIAPESPAAASAKDNLARLAENAAPPK